MPGFDMPLNELKIYGGTNPCPADFDEFWDNSIKEMKSIDSDIEIKKSNFTTSFAECFDLYFTGMFGAGIHAKYLRPKKTEKRHPGLVEFHGYAGSSGDWSEKFKFVAAGYSIMAMDCRGQGGESIDTGGVSGNTLQGHLLRGINDAPEKMLFRNIYLDAAQLVNILMDMPEVDENRVGVFGGSQGGTLAIAAAALEPKINKVVSIIPGLSDFKRTWEIDADSIQTDEIKQWFRAEDPTHKREDEIFTRLGYIDIQNFAKRIKAETLMVTGLMDQICPPSTQFAVYNKIISKKEVVIYPDFGHEAMPGLGDLTYKHMEKL